MERKQFTFYRSYYKAMSKLSVTARGRLLDMVIRYALDGEEPQNMTDQQYMAFHLIQPTLDSSRKKAIAVLKKKKDTDLLLLSDCPDTGREGEIEKEFELEIKKESEKEIKTEIELEGEGERPAPGSGVSGFENFWNLFPVKFGKESARAVWIKKGLEEAVVLPGLNKWLRSSNWRKENGKYIPRAAKFLEEEHYIQDPPGDVPMGCSGQLGKAELEAIAAIMKGE